MDFFYHIVFLSLTLDYDCHSCKVYLGLAKEKSLNCICCAVVEASNFKPSSLKCNLVFET